MSEKEIDVTALGEILIDFTFAGKNADGKNLFEENPGGAPANCAVAISRLGGKSAFIGMTGFDSFGEDLKSTLEEQGVNVSGMRKTKSQHTTLAFVTLDSKGERNFSFCRNPGADTRLSPEVLDEELISKTRILHIGSLSLTDEPAKSATLKAIDSAKKSEAYISYDPNYRAALWGERSDAIPLMKSILPLSDMVKVSDEELALLYGKDISPKDGAREILAQGAKLVLVTLGSKGVYYATNTKTLNADGTLGVPDVKVVDTTGAGDSFTGGLLYRLTRKAEPFSYDKAELEKDISFANAVASLCVTKRGAIPALPTLLQVEAFIKEHNM